jgi:hypothetical protein
MSESEKRFCAVFSESAVGITIASAEGEWLDVNDGFCGIIGYRQAELREKSIWISHTPTTAKCVSPHPPTPRWGELFQHDGESYLRKDSATA